MAAGLLASIGFATIPAAAEAGETLDRVLAAKTLVLAVDEEYPPFASRNYAGELKGFDIDVARELAARLGVALKVVTPGWNEIMAGDWQGRWDIAMGGLEASAAQAAGLDAAAVYADAPAVILVHSGAAEVAGSGDLRGKRVGRRGRRPLSGLLERESPRRKSCPSIEPMAIDDLPGQWRGPGCGPARPAGGAGCHRHRPGGGGIAGPPPLFPALCHRCRAGRSRL